MSKDKTDYHVLIEMEAPPNLPNNGDRVELMRDRFESIRKNYGGMLYFCSRIVGVPKDKLTMLMLEQFEITRFHEHQEFVKNHSFPVSHYIDTIKELKTENESLRAQLAEANAELEKVKAEIHKYKPDSEMLGMLQEVDGFIALTEQLDQHPDGYDGPCLCAECLTYL